MWKCVKVIRLKWVWFFSSTLAKLMIYSNQTKVGECRTSGNTYKDSFVSFILFLFSLNEVKMLQYSMRYNFCQARWSKIDVLGVCLFHKKLILSRNPFNNDVTVKKWLNLSLLMDVLWQKHLSPLISLRCHIFTSNSEENSGFI